MTGALGRDIMRNGSGALAAVAAAAVVVLGSSAPAYALTAKATLVNGTVSVSGGQAAKSTPILWEGAVVATASKGGNFAFVSTYVPADCIGTVSNGTTSIDVRVEGCSGSLTGL